MSTSSGPAPPTAPPAAALRRLCLSAFCMDGGFFLIMAAVPFKILLLGGGPVELGLAPALTALVYVVLTRLAGRWSDRSGRGALCVGGGLLLVVFALLAWLANELPLLLVLMPLLGLGKALYWPVAQAAVGDLSGRRLERTLGFYNACWCGGKTLGFLAVGFLLSGGSFRITFACGSLLALAAAVALPDLRRLPAVGRSDEAGATGTPGAAGAIGAAGAAHSTVAAAVPPERRRLYRHLGWSANAAANAAAVILAAHLPGLFAARGWSERHFGLFLGALFLVQTLTFLALTRRRVFDFTFPALGLALSVVMLGLAGLPWLRPFGLLMLLAPPLGVACGICYAASLYYSLHGPSRRGRHAGVHESLIGVAGFLPPLAAGLAATAWGLGAAYPLAAALAALTLAWQAGRLRAAAKS